MFKIKCSCIICHKEICAKGIHLHHIKLHTNSDLSGKGTLKFITRCSCISCRKETTIQSLERHIKQCSSPIKYNKCKYCGNETRNDKFCGHICSAKYNIQKRKDDGYVITQEQKDKTSRTLIEKHYIGIKRCNHPPKPKICKVCNNRHIRGGYTCSYTCQMVLMTNGGKKAASNRKIRSKDEIKLFELISNIVPALSNHIIKDGWDSDIFIPSLNIAIFWNGPWHYKEMGIKGHSLKQVQNRDKIKTALFESIGIKVIVYEDRYFSPETALKSFIAGAGFAPAGSEDDRV